MLPARSIYDDDYRDERQAAAMLPVKMSQRAVIFAMPLMSRHYASCQRFRAIAAYFARSHYALPYYAFMLFIADDMLPLLHYYAY